MEFNPFLNSYSLLIITHYSDEFKYLIYDLEAPKNSWIKKVSVFIWD